MRKFLCSNKFSKQTSVGNDACLPSFQYKSKIVFSLNLEFVPPYVFLLNPDYVNNNNK